MIIVSRSKPVDSDLDVQDLIYDSSAHIAQVRLCLKHFQDLLETAGLSHDLDKLTQAADFHRELVSGFKECLWWTNHLVNSRHHLLSRIPADVNLLDVLEMVADSVTSGLARTGQFYPLQLPSELLQLALQNTVSQLLAVTEVRQ